MKRAKKRRQSKRRRGANTVLKTVPVILGTATTMVVLDKIKTLL